MTLEPEDALRLLRLKGKAIIRSFRTEPEKPFVGSPFKLIVEGYNFNRDVDLWVQYTLMGMFDPHPKYADVKIKSHSRSTIKAEVFINPWPRENEKYFTGRYIVSVGRNYRQEDSKPLQVYLPSLSLDTERRFVFKSKKSKPLPQGYTVTIAKMLIEAWASNRSLTQKEILEKARRWEKRQKVPLMRDRQWLYDRISPIRKALLDVKINMPQAKKRGYPPPGKTLVSSPI